MAKPRFPVIGLGPLLQRQIKQILYNQIQIRRVRLMDRKEDARKKIQLGGLFIKAGLDHMHPKDAYILYGMLLDCKRALEVKPEVKNRWKELGKELLLSNSTK